MFVSFFLFYFGVPKPDHYENTFKISESISITPALTLEPTPDSPAHFLYLFVMLMAVAETASAQMNLQLTASDYNGYNVRFYNCPDGGCAYNCPDTDYSDNRNLFLPGAGTSIPYNLHCNNIFLYVMNPRNIFLLAVFLLPALQGSGQPVGEIQKLQQQKIEELTLYVIELEKRIARLEGKQ